MAKTGTESHTMIIDYGGSKEDYRQNKYDTVDNRMVGDVCAQTLQSSSGRRLRKLELQILRNEGGKLAFFGLEPRRRSNAWNMQTLKVAELSQNIKVTTHRPD